MALKHFENKARQSFWLVHVEAWHRSGLSQTRYCRKQHLARNTFGRWLNYLVSLTQTHKRSEYPRNLRCNEQEALLAPGGRPLPRQHRSVSTGKRSLAVQAFWAMHVEALEWSGMSAGEYAAGLNLSSSALRKWRHCFEDEEIVIDWRAHLHPSARPKISTRAKGSAKESEIEPGLTLPRVDDPKLSTPPPRRRFNNDEKLAIVLEVERKGESVSSVARRHGIVTSLLFRWRARLGFGKGSDVKLATVTLADGQAVAHSTAHSTDLAPALVLHDLLPVPEGMKVVELDDGRKVFAPSNMDEADIRLHVLNREAMR